MEWTPECTRGTGLIVDLLRDRWRHATMYALRDGPLQPHAVEEVFGQASERNVPIFGPHVVYRQCVVRHLSELLRGSLLTRHNLRGVSAETYYRLTPLAVGLLDAIVPAAEFGVSQYPELVAMNRDARGLPPVAVAAMDLAALAGPERTYLVRRCGTLLFGVLLAPPWTLAVLAGLAPGERGATALTADVNVIIGNSGDWLTTASISRGTVHARLAKLTVLGYVEPGPGLSHRLTGRGRALLGSLVPAAEFGIVHDEELAAAARAVARRRPVRPPDSTVN